MSRILGIVFSPYMNFTLLFKKAYFRNHSLLAKGPKREPPNILLINGKWNSTTRPRYILLLVVFCHPFFFKTRDIGITKRKETKTTHSFSHLRKKGI